MALRNGKSDALPSDAKHSTVPAGAPTWANSELIEQTIRVWQPYYTAPLTPEEAIAIIQSVGRLVEVLSGEPKP
jgi:hypothetical protein